MSQQAGAPPGRRGLLLCSGAIGLAAAGAATARLVTQPAQAFTEWPAAALCAVRRLYPTAYEQRLIERRTTRLQARRAAMGGVDAP